MVGGEGEGEGEVACRTVSQSVGQSVSQSVSHLVVRRKNERELQLASCIFDFLVQGSFLKNIPSPTSNIRSFRRNGMMALGILVLFPICLRVVELLLVLFVVDTLLLALIFVICYVVKNIK